MGSFWSFFYATGRSANELPTGRFAFIIPAGTKSLLPGGHKSLKTRVIHLRDSHIQAEGEANAAFTRKRGARETAPTILC